MVFLRFLDEIHRVQSGLAFVYDMSVMQSCWEEEIDLVDQALHHVHRRIILMLFSSCTVVRRLFGDDDVMRM